MEPEISPHAERYLEAVYRLSDRGAFVPVGELARFLSVTSASVTEMAKKLGEQGFLEHPRYGGIRLTDAGRRIGGEAVRRHRLAERLLTDLLGASPELAHDEARRLEGFLRGAIELRVMEVLGYPQTCPHGNPLNVGSVENAIPLTAIETDRAFRIARIRYDTLDALDSLRHRHLVPGSIVIVRQRRPDRILLEVNGEDQEIDPPAGERVWVFPNDAETPAP